MSELNVVRNLYDVNDNVVNQEKELFIRDRKIVYRQYNDFHIGRITRKIEQGIEKNSTIDEAINRLIENPFAGERYQGDLVNLLAGRIEEIDLDRSENRRNLHIIIELSDDNIEDFKWSSDIIKERFDEDVQKLKKLLRKH